MYSKEDREIYFFDHLDLGAEPPDQKDVWAFGYEVKDLVRIRIMNIRLGSLKEGAYRKLTDEELEELYEMLK